MKAMITFATIVLGAAFMGAVFLAYGSLFCVATRYGDNAVVAFVYFGLVFIPAVGFGVMGVGSIIFKKLEKYDVPVS